VKVRDAKDAVKDLILSIKNEDDYAELKKYLIDKHSIPEDKVILSVLDEIFKSRSTEALHQSQKVDAVISIIE
jgi:hypothetical protein